MNTNWNPKLYLNFKKERKQPSIDLVNRIELEHPQRIIDLGCGPGNSAQVIRNRWPTADITGLDSSSEMIAKARKEYPAQNWEMGSITEWSDSAGYDLVFSNAALQWIPDHPKLIPHILQQIKPGGAFALQIPTHYNMHPLALAMKIAKQPEWHAIWGEFQHPLHVEKPENYYNILEPHTQYIEMWSTQYLHILDSQEAILNGFRGTGMRPFLQALDNEKQQQKFSDQLLNAIKVNYPLQKDSKVIYPFNRLFMIAYV